MDTMERECVDAIRSDDGYDYLANNAHLMSVEQLKRIAMECLYELHNSSFKIAHLNNIADELEDFWS